MKTAEREVRDLIAELRVQYEKVREKAEFLLLKEDEVREAGSRPRLSSNP